jgi:hypothetical protein
MTQQQMPHFVEEIYEFLKKEITWVHARWSIAEQLYNKSALRVDLLNEAAPEFFYILQLMMLDDLQLSLARLTDPAPGKGSLLQLQKRLESHGNAVLATTAKEVLATLVTKVDPIRARRDNLIAHYSLNHATNEQAAKLPDVYYADVSECLKLFREYMNKIADHYHGITDAYEHIILQSDGDTLATVLKWGMRHKRWLLAKDIYIEPKDKWSDA